MFKRAAAALLLIIILTAYATAQEVNPRVDYTASNDLTTVRLALEVSADLELRFNRRFAGTTPSEVAGWIGFAFGNNTETGAHNLSLVIDNVPLTFRFPDYSSFQLPHELLVKMAAANAIHGSWDAMNFDIAEADRRGIRRFLDVIDPENISELDQPRMEHWPLERTVTYINSLLGAIPASPCNRSSLGVIGGTLHVYVRRCDDDFDNADMFASASKLQQRGLLFINASISVDCVARASCAEVRRRSSAKEEWAASNNTWTRLNIDMGDRDTVAAEKVRNAIEYLVSLLKTP